MSKEDLVLFLQKAAVDARLRARFQQNVSYDDFQAIAKDRGFDLGDLSAGEAKLAIRTVTSQHPENSHRPLPDAFCDRWPDGS